MIIRMTERKQCSHVLDADMILSIDGYSADHIRFRWENGLTDGMSFVPGSTKMLPQYRLTQLSLEKTYNKYVVGECDWVGFLVKVNLYRWQHFQTVSTSSI